MARPESPINKVYSEHDATHLRCTDLQCVSCNDKTANNIIRKVALAAHLLGAFLQVTLWQQHFLKMGRQCMAFQGQGLMQHRHLSGAHHHNL